MKNRKWVLQLTVGTVTLLVLAGAFILTTPFAKAAAPGGRITIPGHTVPSLAHTTPSGATASNKVLQLSIALKLRNQGELNALIKAQNDPHSSSYHQYLTPREFAANFGPTQASVNAVVSYLRSQKLNVGTIAPNHLLIDASGTVDQVQRAFQTNISNYSMHGRSVYAPSKDPSVPTSLSGMILNIGGLDNVAQYHPLAGGHNGSGPGGGFTPSELRTAYDMNSLVSNSDGTGQTIAIFELDGYKASDVNSYLSNYGLGSAKYSNVLVDGATNTAGAGAIEVELDMEVVSAIAPGATQKIYIGPNSTQGVNDTYNRIVTDNIAKVTSTSWGECEASSGNSELSSLDQIFAQGAAQGQAVFAASGDSGAYDCDTTTLAVDSPADDPNVVGVGGTNLQAGTGGSYISESGWNCSTCSGRGPKGTGGGGGISSFFARPGYQTGTNLTNANREVPDVSADADPNSGYSFFCTVAASGCPSSGWAEVGGTSAAAPLWAGVATDTNGYLTSQSKPVLGSASSTIYHLYNTSQSFTAYHDITTGNNLFYNAVAGYDNSTGVGTPDAWNFARDAAGTTTSGNDFSISASPTSLSIQQGSNGTSSISTAVTSGSAGTVSLTANVSPSGPTASLNPTSVTAGGSSTLTVSVGSSVAAGNYTVTVTGTEGSATHTASVAVSVTTTGGGGGVTNGGFETGDFTGWTTAGSTSISSTAHSGSHSGEAGSSSPTNGDSSISQTFTVPSGNGTLSFWYRVTCPDTVQFDWATATLKDNTTGTTTTILGKTCTNTGAWVKVSAGVTAGHSVTLTLISHDDNFSGDPTFTLFDDVALSAGVTNPVVNGGFETGDFTGWTRAGTTSISSTAHSGTHSGEAGASTATNGDSSISQNFTIPSGASTLSFWYQVVCPDTLQFDWATATLKDNSTGTTTTVLAKTCTNTGAWVQVSAGVTAGHSVTLTLISHDDNFSGDPTFTLYDDVTVS